ncbi:MAG TPA: hypothetical protein VNA25_12330 [Phycisphaerae bacterium]|nr:hypothetical protein [Phycisphaerae bacterium]
MDIEVLRDFFMWCTIINAAMLTLSMLMCAACRGLIHRVHGKFFPIPKETLTVVLYAFLGVYKIFLIFFNVVPYVVLLIIG